MRRYSSLVHETLLEKILYTQVAEPRTEADIADETNYLQAHKLLQNYLTTVIQVNTTQQSATHAMV